MAASADLPEVVRLDRLFDRERLQPSRQRHFRSLIAVQVISPKLRS